MRYVFASGPLHQEWCHVNANGGRSIHPSADAAYQAMAEWEDARARAYRFVDELPRPASAGVQTRWVSDWVEADERVQDDVDEIDEIDARAERIEHDAVQAALSTWKDEIAAAFEAVGGYRTPQDDLPPVWMVVRSLEDAGRLPR